MFQIINKENINNKDNYNRTPLFLAVINYDFELAKELLDLGADPNIACREENATSLHVLCERNNPEMVKLIIKSYNGNINSNNILGNSLLHYAAYGVVDNIANLNDIDSINEIDINNYSLMIWLIDKGLDPYKRNNEGHTPQDILNNYCYYIGDKYEIILKNLHYDIQKPKMCSCF